MTTASFDLAELNGRNGFVINGIDAFDLSGLSVSTAGDLNGDGIDDLIVGAFGADPNGNTDAGESYVVFGQSEVFSASLDLSTLDGSNGFVINGIDAGDNSGFRVSTAGDLNGDGIDDLIVGAVRADPNGNIDAGESYVVFGSSHVGSEGSLDLAKLNGRNGFVINGIDAGDYSGVSVSTVGDINGDGIDDLIVGAVQADPNGNIDAGESYVVFGGSNVGAGGNLNLSALDGSNGFVLNGIDEGDYSGLLSVAGDINGDGIDDLIIGAFRADPNGNTDAGESYVVFGQSEAFSASLDLSALDGSNGFALNGIDAGDESGGGVSAAGDINGDGIDDLIIGAFRADPNGNTDAGESYVVFGSSHVGSGGSLDLSSLDGSNGFVLNGIDAYDFSGISVSAAGDINGDGIDDLIVGAVQADPNGNTDAGESYVVFGFKTIKGTPDDDLLLGTSSRDHINGFYGNDTIIGRAGDDTIDGSAGRDRLLGNDGYDSLLGGEGRDFLVGNRGEDLLDGGADGDLLFGGRDADRFVLREGDGPDTIFDYQDGIDSFLLDSGLAFEDLTITQGFGQTVISITDTSEELASLLGVDASDLGAEDFSTLV